MADLRDFDVISAARDALAATGEFDGVYPGGLPEEEGATAGDTYAAYLAVRDWDEPTEFADDEFSADSGCRRVRYRLTLAVRRDDREERDRDLDRLFGVAANALDGVSLADLTLPRLTRLRRGTWEKPVPPERRMTCWGEFAYLVGDDDHATGD